MVIAGVGSLGGRHRSARARRSGRTRVRLADVVTQALDGWFVFGATNILREAVARVLDASGLEDHVRDPETHRDLKVHAASPDTPNERFLYGSSDSTTLLYLLSRPGDRLRLLVGHSKGNYGIENALEG